MTTARPLTDLYYLNAPILAAEKVYRRGSVMAYSLAQFPLWAMLVQRAGLEDWLDADDFGCTCFVPSEEYSRKYLNYFMQNTDIMVARRLVLGSIIKGAARRAELAAGEIPTFLKGHYLQGETLGDFIQKADLVLENGIIQIVPGLVLSRVPGE